MTHVKHRPHIKDISQAHERCSNRPKAIVGEEGVSYRTHKTASVALATLVLLLCDSIQQCRHLMEQVDNPDHSLFRPPWNATKQSYAKQRGKWTMRAQSNAANSEPDTVVPFAPAFENAAADSTDQLDRAGQTILNMLQNAANLAEANSQHALDMAQRLSHQLRAAEARIAELEAEGQSYQDRAERAEQWLHRIYSEIEDRFLKNGDRRTAVTGAPRRNA